MPVVTEYLTMETEGNAEVRDITAQVRESVKASGLQAGLVCVSCIGSTGAVTTCEFEPGLVRDIKDLLDRLIPAGDYHHDQAWSDGNGHSHLRASLIGPSVTVPFVNAEPILGTWQQIVFIDCDNRPRSRRLIVQMIGE